MCACENIVNIKSIKFETLTDEDINRASFASIFESKLYHENRIQQNSLGDARLGCYDSSQTCKTCKNSMDLCPGHFGVMNPSLPLINAGFAKPMMTLFHIICKNCGFFIAQERSVINYLMWFKGKRDFRAINEKKRKMVADCSKDMICPSCLSYNGKIKKSTPLTLQYSQYKSVRMNSSCDQSTYIESVEAAKKSKIIKSSSTMCDIGIDPTDYLNILKRISTRDSTVIVKNPSANYRPESMLFKSIPIPPLCLRPAVISLADDSRQDDITVKLMHIISINEYFKHPSYSFKEQMNHYVAMLYECIIMINSNFAGLPKEFKPPKLVRSYFTRLKGKQGRFRGNLSGKRANFTGRTVISPDPYLSIDQVSIPKHMAKILTYPIVVTHNNIKEMRRLVVRGPNEYPGAIMIYKANDRVVNLNFGDRKQRAHDLKLGDTVQRQIMEGDIVLFNRQPSLHRESIQAFYVNIGPTRTLRFNECCCTPFNADFDGDEMNIHVPQGEVARAESLVLMASTSNMISHKNGEPLTAGIQDFVSGMYILTRKDVFLSRDAMIKLTNTMRLPSDISPPFPPPTMIKPVELWTGKQIITYLLKHPPAERERGQMSVNIQSKGKSYSGNEEFCENDSYCYIDDSDFIAGTLDKNFLGSGAKSNIFYFLTRNYGRMTASQYISRVCRLSVNFLFLNLGFTIKLGDSVLTNDAAKTKEDLFRIGNNKCRDYIRMSEDGTLEVPPGLSTKDALEGLLLKELSAIRDEAGKKCLIPSSLKLHSIKAMTCSGAKGSINNHCQMAAIVGQQAIMGHRAPESYNNRSHLRFPANDVSAMARGFVNNSFFTGLNDQEFSFHMMAGREGLVDAAIKTAETGYMQRRIIKGVEDIHVTYDNTVRSCDGQIIQFIYGSDGFSPAEMEGDSRPIDFKKLFIHTLNTCPDDSGDVLSPSGFKKIMEDWDESFKTLNEGAKEEVKKFVSELERNQTHAYKTFSQLLPLSAFSKSLRITSSQLRSFLNNCTNKFRSAQIEPGTAIGAITAQSIGEPATQMTLKAFHFTGLASMTITQGVPRIKEIINAMKNIQTPVIRVGLVDNTDMELVKKIKLTVESTRLGQISTITSEMNTFGHRIVIMVDEHIDQIPCTESDMERIVSVILNSKVYLDYDQVRRSGREIYISLMESTMLDCPLTISELKQLIIKGIPQIKQAVISSDCKNGIKTYELAVNGNSFGDIIGIPGVDGLKTKSNHIFEVFRHLGIEAARSAIIEQIEESMSSHGISVDKRHLMLIADTMTSTGDVKGMTIHGVADSKEGTLTLASFERATDFLYDSAFNGQRDEVKLVSESIMMGKPIKVGTGMFELIRGSSCKPDPVYGKIICSKRPKLTSVFF